MATSLPEYARVHAWETGAWKELRAHAEEIRGTHLRDLLEVRGSQASVPAQRVTPACARNVQDEARCSAMTTEFDGILLDYCRQNATPRTLVRCCDLACRSVPSSAHAVAFRRCHTGVA